MIHAPSPAARPREPVRLAMLGPAASIVIGIASPPLAAQGEGHTAPGGADATCRVMREPEYPRAALRLGIDGSLTARITVGGDGMVRSVEFIDSTLPAAARGLFERSVRTALASYRCATAPQDYQLIREYSFRAQ
jgi:outer membrane biosynthesis protein TonB